MKSSNLPFVIFGAVLLVLASFTVVNLFSLWRDEVLVSEITTGDVSSISSASESQPASSGQPSQDAELTTDNQDISDEEDEGAWGDLEALMDEQGAVSVQVAPLNLAGPLQFQVSMNTHSVDLSMNLAALATLVTDSGLTLYGTAWDGPAGGHHVSGTLEIAISPEELAQFNTAKEFTLTISEVDAASRTFTWSR